jgi:hypothetical protein
MLKSVTDPVNLNIRKFTAGNAKVVTKMSKMIHQDGRAGWRMTGKK